MDNKIIERALTCRLIDTYMKQSGLEGPLTNEHLAKVSWHIIELLTSTEVRAMYDENEFHGVDVECTDLYDLYTQRLAERFAGVRFGKYLDCTVPLTEEHVCGLISDFQDLIWDGYGDGAIEVD